MESMPMGEARSQAWPKYGRCSGNAEWLDHRALIFNAARATGLPPDSSPAVQKR